MIGLNFVCEKDELLYSLVLRVKLENRFSLDYLDFDNQSFEDIIDYMEFLEFEQYIFVVLKENIRLKRLVTYLSDRINYPVCIFDMNDLGNLLSGSEMTSVQNALESHSGYQNVLDLETEKAFQNGYRMFMSAVYPNLTKGLLKHLRVDQLDIFLAENQDLLLHFAINSAIYSDSYSGDPSIPLIIKSPLDFEVEIFAKVMAAELKDALDQFLKSGRLTLTNNVLDYGILSGISKFNSLVFEDGKFYLDSATNIPIGYSGDTYQKLFNEASMKLTRQAIEGISEVLHLLPLLIAINRSYDDLKFITPYNSYLLEAVKQSTVPLSWIAFKNSDHYFAFNIQNGRLFKINQMVFEKLEYIIKNRFNEKDTATQKVMEALEAYAQ